jgi:glycosyltransferase involved in cell wall biosynthesis
MGDAPKLQVNKQKIALCMIVKDEESVITRCFDSVRGIVDYYVICDTGSTDNTIKVIKDYWKQHGLKGELHEKPWVNFAHNRTEVMSYGSSAPVDYLMTLDADEIIATFKEGVIKPDEEVVKLPHMTEDAIYVTTVYGNTEYRRTQFVKRGLSWRWSQPIHEYCWAPDASTEQYLDEICCKPTPDGARSSDPNKYIKDALVFEKYILDHPTEWRSYFYLAQSYADAGAYDKALKPLEVAIENCDWIEEKFIAKLRKARYRRQTGFSVEGVLADYLEAYACLPSRAEPLYDLLNHYRVKEDWSLAILFGEKAVSIPHPPPTSLFVEPSLYDWKIKDELALAYHYSGRNEEAVKLGEDLKEVASTGKIPSEEIARLEVNLEFYRKGWPHD